MQSSYIAIAEKLLEIIIYSTKSSPIGDQQIWKKKYIYIHTYTYFKKHCNLKKNIWNVYKQ